MHLRLPRVEHASWTISARHLGVVVGLAILTPVFIADLQDAQVPAQEAITALVLDAPLTAQDKIALAQALGRRAGRRSRARCPTCTAPSRRWTSRPTDVRPRPSSSATSTTSWSAPRPGPSATRSSSAPAWPSSPCSPWSRRTGGGAPMTASGPRSSRLPALAAGPGGRRARRPARVRRRDLRAARSRPTRASRGRSPRSPRGSTASPSGSCSSASTTPPAAWASAARRSPSSSPSPATRTDAQIDALREGLLAAVDRMEDDGIAAAGLGAGRRGARQRRPQRLPQGR